MAKRGKGIALLSIGCVLILVAGVWFAFNIIEDNKAGKQSAVILDKLNDVQSTVYDDNAEVAVIDGEKYCGKITLEKLGIDLPVHHKWNYPRMKTAPCRYSGSLETNDLIIVAHNYKSHFGSLNKAKIGDEVKFVDVNGKTHLYEVCELQTIDGLAVDDMQAGGWDLTLFTCNRSGKLRVTVRCKRK